MNEEMYRLTPRGFFYSSLGETKGTIFESELKAWMKKVNINAIILEGRDFTFETVKKEWD